MDEPGPDIHDELAEHYRAPEPPSRPEAEPPHWSLWLLYLVFRPRLFFETFVLRSLPALTALTAWLYGTVSVMDRVETRVLLSSRHSPIYEALRRNWTAYWLFSAGMGLLSGLFYFWIGGWWYRVRLRWSGAADPDPGLARRVYLYASQAYVVPFVLYVTWESAVYASPSIAAAGDDFGGLIVVVAAFWSCYISYRGVRTAFEVRRWPARFWFALLPGLLYAGTVALILAVLFLGGSSGRLEGLPDLHNVQRVDRDGFSLEYPGNWEIDVSDEDYDPDYDFSIGTVFADATLQFWFYGEPMDSAECVDQTFLNLSQGFDVERGNPMESWGGYPGAGFRGRLSIEGNPYVVISFCSTEGPRPFEIMWICQADQHDRLLPGLERIGDSLELKPAAVEEGLLNAGALFR